MKTRVGVIGVGNMGSHHVRILSELTHAQLVGVHDVDRERAEAAATRHGVPAYAQLPDLLAAADAVVVAVPADRHQDVGSQALAAGCHVLMEKPLAHCVEAAVSLCEQADRSPGQLMVGYVERFNPAVVRMRELLRTEEVLYLSFTRVGPEAPADHTANVIIDLAIHDLDLLLYLSGREVVRATALAVGASRQDTASLSFLLDGGGLAHVTANWLTPFKVREIQAATARYLYRCDLIRQQLTVYSRLAGEASGYAVREIPVPVQEPLRVELAAFVGAVARGEPVPVLARDGLRSLILAEECLRMAEVQRVAPAAGE